MTFVFSSNLYKPTESAKQTREDNKMPRYKLSFHYSFFPKAKILCVSYIRDKNGRNFILAVFSPVSLVKHKLFVSHPLIRAKLCGHLAESVGRDKVIFFSYGVNYFLRGNIFVSLKFSNSSFQTSQSPRPISLSPK